MINRIKIYYAGSDSEKKWIKRALPKGLLIKWQKLPGTNAGKLFFSSPNYVTDILYLDKPDFIISAQKKGSHEKPIVSIEYSACTPQYQHGIQRFSRMLASATQATPSIIIIPKQKKANSDNQIYTRTKAIAYGAVKIKEIFNVPAYIFDWPEKKGILNHSSLPNLKDVRLLPFKKLLKEMLFAFDDSSYLKTLVKSKISINESQKIQEEAFASGAPTIMNPGGGIGNVGAKLDKVKTSELIKTIIAKLPKWKHTLSSLPTYFTQRKESVVFYPTRIIDHAGDPYVGMASYYDMAFCRNGPNPRERHTNLVADASQLSISEISDTMIAFKKHSCPFSMQISPQNLLKYSFYLKRGCRETKTKPLRIYSEIVDLLIFKDGVFINVGL